MKPNFAKLFFGISAAIGLALVFSPVAKGQILINWNTSTGIPLTGDTDISTTGSYFDAVNTSQSGYTTTTDSVNGVTFNALSFTGGTGTDGTITVSLDGSTYADDGFAGGSASYQDIVDTGSDASAGTVTIGSLANPLTIGATYQVEVWSVWTHGPYQAEVTGSPNVVFSYAADAYAIGTFTANATTESFTWTGANGPGSYGFLNDISVRETPEPSITLLMAGAGVMLLAGTWLRRRMGAC